MFSRTDKYITYVLMASIFTTSISIITEPRIPLPYFLVCLALLYLIMYKRPQFYRKKYLLIGLMALGIHGVLGVFTGSTQLQLFLPTYALTVVIFLAFHSLISKIPYPVDIVRCYVKLCFFVAVIGFIQYVFFLLRFEPGYDFSGFLTTISPLRGAFGIRLASILSEPSHVAFCMGPALVLAVYTLVQIRTPFITMIQSVTLLLFALLSGSTTVYILLAVGFLTVPFVRKGKVVLVGSLVAAVLFFSSSILSSVALQSSIFRVTDLIELLKYGSDSRAFNASSYTAYFHFKVALNSLAESYWLGGGIGSHLLAFERVFGADGFFAVVYSQKTAGGLFNRLVSELGVFGIAALVAFIATVINRIRYLRGLHLVMHFIFAIGVLGFLVRQGSYSQFGIAFYLLMFILTPKLRLTRDSR